MPFKLAVASGSPAAVKAIKMAFTRPGYSVYTFDDGASLEKSLEEVRPDALLLSLSLPLKSGTQIGRDSMGRTPFRKLPVILLAGAYESIRSEDLSGLVFDEIVRMPFDSAALERTVRRLIEGRKEPHSFPEEPGLPESAEARPKSPFLETNVDHIEKKLVEWEQRLSRRIKGELRMEMKTTLEELLREKNRIDKGGS